MFVKIGPGRKGKADWLAAGREPLALLGDKPTKKCPSAGGCVSKSHEWQYLYSQALNFMYVIELAIAIFIVATFPEKRIVKSDDSNKESIAATDPEIELLIDGADHFYNAGMWLKKPVHN